jgi:hypothetical protein
LLSCQSPDTAKPTFTIELGKIFRPRSKLSVNNTPGTNEIHEGAIPIFNQPAVACRHKEQEVSGSEISYGERHQAIVLPGFPLISLLQAATLGLCVYSSRINLKREHQS